MYNFLYDSVANFVLAKKFKNIIRWYTKVRVADRIQSFKTWLYNKWFTDKFAIKNLINKKIFVHENPFFYANGQRYLSKSIDFYFSRNYGLDHVNGYVAITDKTERADAKFGLFIKYSIHKHSWLLYKILSLVAVRNYWNGIIFKKFNLQRLLLPGSRMRFFLFKNFLRFSFKNHSFLRVLWRGWFLGRRLKGRSRNFRYGPRKARSKVNRNSYKLLYSKYGFHFLKYLLTVRYSRNIVMTNLNALNFIYLKFVSNILSPKYRLTNSVYDNLGSRQLLRKPATNIVVKFSRKICQFSNKFGWSSTLRIPLNISFLKRQRLFRIKRFQSVLKYFKDEKKWKFIKKQRRLLYRALRKFYRGCRKLRIKRSNKKLIARLSNLPYLLRNKKFRRARLNKYKRKLIKRFIWAYKNKLYAFWNRKESQIFRLTDKIGKLQMNLVKLQDSKKNKDLTNKIHLLTRKINFYNKIIFKKQLRKNIKYNNRNNFISNNKFSIYLKNYKNRMILQTVPLRYSTKVYYSKLVNSKFFSKVNYVFKSRNKFRNKLGNKSINNLRVNTCNQRYFNLRKKNFWLQVLSIQENLMSLFQTVLTTYYRSDLNMIDVKKVTKIFKIYLKRVLNKKAFKVSSKRIIFKYISLKLRSWIFNLIYPEPEVKKYIKSGLYVKNCVKKSELWFFFNFLRYNSLTTLFNQIRKINLNVVRHNFFDVSKIKFLNWWYNSFNKIYFNWLNYYNKILSFKIFRFSEALYFHNIVYILNKSNPIIRNKILKSKMTYFISYNKIVKNDKMWKWN